MFVAQSSNGCIVEVKGVKKNFKHLFGRRKVAALKGVDISVYEKEIFGILGPNGSGKTTLLNCLSLLLEPDDGSIVLFGEDVHKDPEEMKRRMNMCSGNPNFPWCLTVRESLNYYGMLYGLCGDSLSHRVDKLIDLLALEEYANVRYDELSTGTKQKLALAKALINNPRLLFLDEPTVGLDPDVAGRIRSLIKNIHETENITVIMTTHYMAEAELLCDRIAFLRSGKILAVGTAEEMKRRVSARNLEEVFVKMSEA